MPARSAARPALATNDRPLTEMQLAVLSVARQHQTRADVLQGFVGPSERYRFIGSEGRMAARLEVRGLLARHGVRGEFDVTDAGHRAYEAANPWARVRSAAVPAR